MRRLAVLAVLAFALGGHAVAHAEIWGYVDERGVAHFAAEKLDERYALFFRGGESFDTSEGVQAPRPLQAPAAVGSKLLAYFDVSPSYRQVKQHLRDAAAEHGIEPELLQALIATESGFDPSAVSPKGAIGLMQVLPATAQRYGLSGDAKMPLAMKLTDPRTNIRTGVRYLSDLIRMFPGQLELALAAYNAGEGAVQRAGNRIPNYRETQNYVKTVMQLYTMLKPQRLAAAPGGPVPRRIHMELPGPAPGLARRNMPPGFTPALSLDTAALPPVAGATRD
jgi:hypothetical protein